MMIFVLAVFVALIGLSVAVTATLVRIGFKPATAAKFAGLGVPLLLFGYGFIDFVINQEVDDPPPGMVLQGGLILALIAIPLALLSSFGLVWWLKRRTSR